MSDSNPARAALKVMEARFLARGIDLSDFQRLAARIDNWEDWVAEWEALGDQYVQFSAADEEAGWRQSAGEASIRAGLAYHFGKAVATEDGDGYRDLTRRCVDACRRGLELVDPGFERIEAPLDGHYVVGNLRRPAGVERPPLALLVPGTESTKEEFYAWEREFLARGMATLSIDGPGQGEVGFELRIRHDYEVAVTALLDALGGRRDLDLDRVVAAGISLGGYYVIRAAAFEPRLGAVLANCGPYNLADAWETLGPMYQAKYEWNMAASSNEEARERAAGLNLEGVTDQVAVPVLVVFGEADVLIGPEHGRRMASEIERAELWMFPGGNHGATNFATRHLGPGADWLLAAVSS